MQCHRLFLLVCICRAYFLARPPVQIHVDEWQPIWPAELQMTSMPEAPGVPAVYLYRQVDRDDRRE
jgi:hypothetical protein